MPDRLLPVAAAGDDGQRSGGSQALAQGVGVISLVGDEAAHRTCRIHQFAGHGDIGDVARGEAEDGRAAQKVGYRMDFRGLAAA